MEMLFVNPKKRGKRKMARRRKMSALQRKYFGKRRTRRNPSRRRSHHRRVHRVHHRRRRNPESRTTRRRAARAGWRHRRRHHRRRNPISLRPRGIMGQITGALPGTFGALGLDILLGVLPIPATWKAGTLGYVTKIAGAIGLGMLANTTRLVSSHTAGQMTQGALTVMFHGILRDFIATNVPSVPLGMYMAPKALPVMAGLGGSGYNPTMHGLGAYLPDMSGGGPSVGESLSVEGYY
jgi:hypothetical protein